MANVQGKIVLPNNANNFTGATVYVIVEQVGMMDAPAAIVAQQTINNVTNDGGAIDFSFDADVSDNGQFNVRAHISMNGSTDFAKGDYITKSRYNLQNAPVTLNVEVV